MTSPDHPLSQHRQQQQQLHYGGNGAIHEWRNNGTISPPPSHHVLKETASSPVPPGFGGGESGSGGGNAPPGFNSDKYNNHKNNSTNSVQGGSNTTTTTTMSETSCRDRGDNSNQNNNHNNNTNNGGNKSSSLAAALAKEQEGGGAGGGGGRTSSFVNLAAVLGTGLAESMDDATSGDWSRQAQLQQQHQQGSALQDLSFARQSRHAAARLIGASPPRADPLGLEAGGNYHLGGAAAAPATLSAGNNNNTFSTNGNGNGNFNSSNHNTGNKAATGLQAGFFSARTDEAVVNRNNRGSESPLGIFGSNPSRASNSRDVGVTVMEPVDQRGFDRGDRRYEDISGGVLGAMLQEHYQENRGSPERDASGNEKCYECQVERGMRNLWVDDNLCNDNTCNSDLGRSGGGIQQQKQLLYHADSRSVGNSSQRSAGSHSQSSRQIAESEVRPFIWDTRIPQQYQQHVEPSRCLAILRCGNLHVPEVRSHCEAFGVLESFRSDFADRGIIFVSYFDIRSAQYAALELEGILKRNDCTDCNTQGIAVYYCVPLNCSTQNDESRIILADVPAYIGEHQLLDMLSSYGAVRSLKSQGGYYGGSSFEVEFQNVQDAKQAMLELSSTQPFGPDVVVEVGMRSPMERKRGRELLSTIGRWRQSKSGVSPSASLGSRPYDQPRVIHPHDRPESSSTSSSLVGGPPETQLVLGPDGRYSYVVVDSRPGYPPQSSYGAPPPSHHQTRHIATEAPPRQQIVHGPNGPVYITTVSGPPPPAHHTTYIQGGPPPPSSREYYPPAHHHVIHSQYPYDSRDRHDRGPPYYSHHSVSSHPDHASVVSGHSHPHHQHSSNVSVAGASIAGHSVTGASVGGDEKDNKHLVLDLEAVEQGRDSRTSLMVRNIPNKYTQQMLLNEFKENGLGPGVIDFFYLPIDFKNRCNRGYAFINFVDFKDILPFHKRYFGKHWSTFNSDKICDITYARIQGKQAMLKRFENSALMEKDEEYKPLVFISHGPEKGKRIPFPQAASAAANRH